MVVSVIIPSKNEPYLNTLLSSIQSDLKYPHEILIQTEPGLSKAVLTGVKRSKGDVVVVLDADGSHNPQTLNKMISLVKQFPIVIGSRYVKGGRTNDTFFRHFLSRLFCKISQILLDLQIEDPMTGFVVANRQIFYTIKLESIGYKFALELLVKTDGSYNIYEYPIIFDKRKMGVSNTGIREGLRTIVLIFKLWAWKTRNHARKTSVKK